MRITYQKVEYTAFRKWTDSDGKRHRQQKKFWQTQSPWNRGPDGTPRTVQEIYACLKQEAARWEAEAGKDCP